MGEASRIWPKFFRALNQMWAFLNKAWRFYAHMTPSLRRVQLALKREHLPWDHFAIRTLNVPTFRLGELRVCFAQQGYHTQSEYVFPDKHVVAEHMTHDDMEVLGSWFDSRPWVHAGEDFDATLAVRGKAIHEEQCEICHSGGGMDPLDEASMLRGQRADYLHKAFADYREGRRMAVAAMDARFKQITDDQAAALIAFYSSPVEADD